VEKYAEIYIARVLCLHGVPKMIVSDRGSQIVACFWEQLHASLGSHLIHSSAYHPQTDGQTKRVNQILEDMLRAYVMKHPGSWDKNLPWAKFLYNNRYQENLKMAPFEVLYKCHCYTPLNWIEPGEKGCYLKLSITLPIWRILSYGIYEIFFQKALNPFKIQTRFKVDLF
jgi:transposase InsO family protein